MTTLYPIPQPPNIPAASGIYKITCVTTKKIYIGSSINLYNRWQDHRKLLRRNEHHNPKMQAAWNKYGEETFIFEVIELVLPMFQLEREQYWLDKLAPWGKNGFNIARVAQASRTGLTHTPETRERLRVTHLGNPGYWTGKKRPPETCAKMSAAMKGRPGTQTGKTHTPESRAKMSNAATGRTHTPETRAKIGAASIGRVKDAKAMERIRLANLGSTHTLEARAKMSAAKKKTLIIIEPDGTEHTVHGIRDFCKEHGLDQSNLMRIAQGKQKQHKGWKARFPD